MARRMDKRARGVQIGVQCVTASLGKPGREKSSLDDAGANCCIRAVRKTM
jgi:hypothetical protein